MSIKSVDQAHSHASLNYSATHSAANSAAHIDALRATTSNRRWPALLAVVLGVTILLGVGFGSGALHSAAHDTRHGMGFPCH
jgi:cobalt transporter subunit CbtB